MSSRAHLGLRIGSLLVLAALLVLPKTRAAHSDPAIGERAHTAHSLELVSAKPTGTLSDAKPRPRTPRIDEAVIANVDESRLTN